MAVLTISIIAQDPDIANRIRGTIAGQVVANDFNSISVLRSKFDISAALWVLAAQPGWAGAWESALAASRPAGSPTIGADPAVITDGMILSAVQALRP